MNALPGHTPWSTLLHEALGGDASQVAIKVALMARALRGIATPADPQTPYGRNVVHRDAAGEIMLARWTGERAAAPHDHAGARGQVVVVDGRFTETIWRWSGPDLEMAGERSWQSGQIIPVGADAIHSMQPHGPGLTLHFYGAAHLSMRVFDVPARRTVWVNRQCGAWLPAAESTVVRAQGWEDELHLGHAASPGP